MYGRGSHGSESEEEYDVFAEAEKDKVVKTFSKESATSRIKWHHKQDDGNKLESYRELALVDPTESSEATHKTLQHRTSRLNDSVPADVLFSSLASSIASQDTSSARSDMKRAASHAGIFTSGNKNGEMDPGQKRMDVDAVASHFTSGLGLGTETRNRHLKKLAFDRTTMQ